MQQNDRSSCRAYAIENAARFLGGDYAEINIRHFHYQLYLRDFSERNATVHNKIKNKVQDFIYGKKKFDLNDYRKFYDCLGKNS